ncbi:hypothetical protein BKA69DRAFT_1068328 [Paraphysoderma sedebokerense]|nr:hypothetical protein BKA69DRAFT_1068328 [Paraphysoderma sedebokerense]
MAGELPEIWDLPPEFQHYNTTFVVLSFLAIITNSILIVQFYRNRKSINASSISLVHICFCDFSLGVVSAVIYGGHALNRSLPWLWCQLDGIINVSLIGASLLTFTVISVERYLQIVRGKPATASELTILLSLVWIFCLFLSFTPIITRNYCVPQSIHFYCLGDFTKRTPSHLAYSLGCLFVVVVSGVTLTTMYYKIYQKAIRDGFKWNPETFMLKTFAMNLFANNAVAPTWVKNNSSDADIAGRTTNSQNLSIGASQSITSKDKIHKKSAKSESYRKQIELTVRLAIFTIYFYIAWIGTGVSWLYQMFSGNPVPREIDYCVSILTFSTSIVNPLIVLKLDNRWKIEAPKWLQRLLNIKEEDDDV